jgi:hypothetical protein
MSSHVGQKLQLDSIQGLLCPEVDPHGNQQKDLDGRTSVLSARAGR